MNEKQIDDYIDSMEEKNAIYVESELNYASKCHNLEEQLGCPLEVLVKAIKNGIWFINTKYELEYIDEALAFNTKRDSGKFVFDNCCYYCQNIEKSKCNEIYLEDYKKTWWLKEDKSE